MDYIFEWVATNSLHKVAEMLEAGASPNARNTEGTTLLSCACMNRLEKMAKLLLLYGADSSEAVPLDGSQQPPLYWACRYGMRDIAVQLLDAGATLRYKDGAEAELLEAACSGLFFSEVVELLAARGLNMEQEDAAGRRLSCYVVEHGGKEGAQLLERLGVRGWREAAWLEAARRGQTEVLRWLADDKLSLEAALHIACRYNHLHAAEFLLDSGADISALDASGNSLLDVSYHHPAIASLLQSRGAAFKAINYARLEQIINDL